jgi:putative ABC transport system permease protein
VKALRRFVKRLGASVFKQDDSGRLEEELAEHLRLLTEEQLRAGLPANEAARAARIQLGARQAITETYRDEQRLRWLEDLRRDARYGCRMLIRNPGLAGTAILSLALGIGANTAVFSVVNAVLLRPIAAPEPERIVMFVNTSPTGRGANASPAKFAHWRALTDVLDDVAAFRTGVRNLTDGDVPEQVPWGQVSADFFHLFGASFAMGRGFSADEDRPGGADVVVLSRALWERRFGGDSGIIGRAISVGGVPHVVVGVLANFPFNEFGEVPELWTPFHPDPNATDQGHSFRAAGRLKPGVSLEQARARLAVSAGAYRTRFPDSLPKANSFSVDPLYETLVGNVRRLLLVLAGAVGLVLLIACANVANLLLARAAGRAREIAVRSAIGGSRGRIVRQLLTESVVLSLTGGAMGLAVGLAGIRALMSVSTAGLPRVGEAGALVTVDWRVLLFTITMAMCTGLIFGVMPAIQGSRSDLTVALKEGGRSGSGGRGNWSRATLVVVQTSLALVLLIGSALFIRSAIALSRVARGFDATSVLSLQTSLNSPQYRTSASVERAVQEVTRRLRAVPGVEAGTATCCAPLQGGYILPFVIAGRPLEGQWHDAVWWRTISAQYFEVFRIPVLSGRAFTDRDIAGAPPVAIINQAMARKLWPGVDPLTARLTIGRSVDGRTVLREFAGEPERQIVGIVGDTRDFALSSNPDPTMYVPQAQLPDDVNAYFGGLGPMTWAVRTQVPPMSVSQTVEEQIRQATGAPVTGVRTMDAVVERSTSRQRFNMWMMTIFGSVAVLLAAIGIYGLMAYSVAQRQREIGIRLALGAQRGDIRRAIVLQGMRLTAAGLVLGLGAAWGLARFVEAFMFAVDVHDSAVFVSVSVILAVVAVAAVAVPAARASRVDAIVALRHD